MIFYFQYEKARLERKRIVEMSKGYGKPKVGGPFTLKDLDGKEFTEKDLLGKYTLVHYSSPPRSLLGWYTDGGE
jgi:protein SCO1